MADRIILKGMTFYGYHGVLAGEKVAGQPFVVDLVLYLHLDRAGRRDDLACTVDYSQVFDAVKRVVEGERFNLVEALASTIAERVLASFPVEGVRVRVKKPMAPVGGMLEYAAVDLRRWRKS